MCRYNVEGLAVPAVDISKRLFAREIDFGLQLV